MFDTIIKVIATGFLTLSILASVANIAVWNWVFVIAAGLTYLIGGIIACYR